MKFLSKLFDDTCKAYTVAAVILLLLRLAIAGSFENTLIEPASFLLLLPFSIGVALAIGIYRMDKVSHALRLTVHFLLCVPGAFFLLYLPSSNASPSSGLIAFLLLCLLYWAVMGVYLAVSSRRRKAQSKGSYQSVFKK